MICIDPNCTRTDIAARSLCGRHYQQWLRGNPLSYQVPDSQQPDHGPDWCVCEQPDQQPIILFGWVELDDVTECSVCHRPAVVAA